MMCGVILEKVKIRIGEMVMGGRVKIVIFRLCLSWVVMGDMVKRMLVVIVMILLMIKLIVVFLNVVRMCSG